MPRNKQIKRGRKSTVMQDPASIEAVCLAELGKGNQALREKYGIQFSDGQFQYRLSKAKIAAGFKAGDGFRKAWREGRSPYEDILPALLPELKRNYMAEILPQIQHAPVQTSPVKELSPNPSVDDAVKQLKKSKAA